MPSPSDVVLKYVRQGAVVGGRYEIERFIGSGAYGAIFTASDRQKGNVVAIKAIPPAGDGTNETALGRFQREMKVIRSLRHPNIITLFDYGETEHHILYMVLEYVDGATLFDICNENPMSLEEALSVCTQIARGLREAHGKGVIHRDLKPQNIMLTTTDDGGWGVKVLDFGMAKLLSRLGDESIVQLTREGVAVGTPRYIAPEQARGKEVGPYTDLYALGLLFYEMFTGERAVKADSIETAIMSHVNPRPLQLDEIDDVPELAKPVLLKLTEKKVDRRYQTADEVIGDLRYLQRQLRGDESADAPLTGDDAGVAAYPSMHSADELELDYERYDEYRPTSERDPPTKRDRRRASDNDAPRFRLPSSGQEWIECVIGLLLLPVAFVLLTAHFDGMSGPLRAMIGLMPLIVATAGALIYRSADWRVSIFRFILITSFLGIVASHLLGPGNLAVGLLRNPAWFLHSVSDAPVFSALYDFVVGFSRGYASLLMSVSDSVTNQVHGNPV